MCSCTYVQNPVGPEAHLHPAQQEQAIAGPGKNYVTHAPLCILISVANAARHLSNVVRKPQGRMHWENHLAVIRGFPKLCLLASCPLSSQTLLFWCNILVKDHSMSLSASVACWGHVNFQSPCIRFLEAKQAGMERVNGWLSPSRNPVLLVLYLALLALMVICILEHQCVLLAVRGPGKWATQRAEKEHPKSW